MTTYHGAGPGTGITQAAPAPHPAAQAASAQAVLARRPASGTATALPADPFARRPWPCGLGSYQLSGRPAVLVLASLIVALLASSAAARAAAAILLDAALARGTAADGDTVEEATTLAWARGAAEAATWTTLANAWI